MITTSDAFKEAILSRSREFTYRIRANGVTTISPGSVTKIEVEESGTTGEALVPGSFCKNTCRMRVLASEYAAWRGSFFTVEVACNGSEFVSLGKYYVYNVTSSGNKVYLEVEAYNVPSWFMEEPVISASLSVSSFLEDITENTGMAIINPQVLTLQDLGTILYPAETLLPDDTLYPLSVPIELPADSTNLSLLGYIAGYSGYNVKVTRNGNILFYRYDGNTSIQYVCSDELICSDDQLIGYYADISEATDRTMWVERSSEFMGGVDFDETDFVVGAIAVVNGEDSSYQIGSGSVITYQNPFITADYEIDSYYRYLNYRGCSVRWRGNPAVEIGDILRVELGRGEWGNALVMRQKFSIDGGFSHTFECLVNESTEKIVGSMSPVQLKIKKVYDRVTEMYQTAMESIFGAQDGYFNFIDDAEQVLTVDDIANGATIAGFQITDSPTVTYTTKGWRFIYGGLYFSDDGFQTPVHFALTNDGSINADAINTGVLSAIEVNGVTIKASDMFFGNPEEKYVEAVTTDQEDGIIFRGNGVIDFKSTGDFDVKNMESDGTTLANRLWLTNSETQNDTYLQNTVLGDGRLANQVHLYSTEEAITTYLTNWNFSAQESTSTTNANNVRLLANASSNRIDLYNRDENGNTVNWMYLRRSISDTSPTNYAYIVNRKVSDSTYTQNSLGLEATNQLGRLGLYNYQYSTNGVLANTTILMARQSENSLGFYNYRCILPGEDNNTANSFTLTSTSSANMLTISNNDFAGDGQTYPVASRISGYSNDKNNQIIVENKFPGGGATANQLVMLGTSIGQAGSMRLYNNDRNGSAVCGLTFGNSSAQLYTKSGTNLTLYTNGTFRLYDGSDMASIGSTSDGYLTVKSYGEGAYRIGFATISGYNVLIALPRD